MDTDVFSEPVKPRPDTKVVAWLREHESELYVSTMTIGEVRRGNLLGASCSFTGAGAGSQLAAGTTAANSAGRS